MNPRNLQLMSFFLESAVVAYILLATDMSLLQASVATGAALLAAMSLSNYLKTEVEQ